MRQFFKFTFASCLGVFLAMIALTFISIGWATSLISSADSAPSIKNNSILEFNFNKPIPEQTNNLQMQTFDLKNDKTLGLQDLIKSVKNAKEDNRIKGIFLNLEFGGAGLATASAFRDALVDFKENGKFIVAYSKYYTQGTYYIGSVADKVYINPVGGMDFHGFSVLVPSYKKLMDKIGVEMNVFYKGKYKSASEPFRNYAISDEARYQLREFLNPTFDGFLADIAESRNKTVGDLKSVAADLKVRTAEDAISYGLVDATGYMDEILEDMKERIGLEEDEKLPKLSFEDYFKSNKEDTDYSIKNKIAVVIAEGAINVGDGEPGMIGDEKYVKELKKIRKDKKIKAVVLRVNSPGGSPIASENIWREVELIKKAGKPVVVSMGDYAASGGYYISCNADKIVAEPNTLTGSIGVFMMIPNTRALFEDKIGITYDTVLTTKNSVGLNTYFDMSTEEVDYLNGNVESIYSLFKQRVADGRNLTMGQVEEIAQGRVWSGEDALEIGLVDELGGMEKAMEIAAEIAGLDEYRTVEYPKVKDQFQQLMEDLTGQEAIMKSKMLKSELGVLYPHYREIKELMHMKGVQARIPYKVELN